jgi:hypothetical protein
MLKTCSIIFLVVIIQCLIEVGFTYYSIVSGTVLPFKIRLTPTIPNIGDL